MLVLRWPTYCEFFFFRWEAVSSCSIRLLTHYNFRRGCAACNMTQDTYFKVNTEESIALFQGWITFTAASFLPHFIVSQMPPLKMRQWHSTKAGSMAPKFRNNRLIEPYSQNHKSKFKVRSRPLCRRWGQLKVSNINVYIYFWVCGIQIWHYFWLSEAAIPSEMDILELYHFMKQQDFLFSSEFCIENELKVDEINIKVRNRTELNLVGQESKVYWIKKFRIRPSFNSRALFESTRLVPEYREISVARLVLIFAGSIQHYPQHDRHAWATCSRLILGFFNCNRTVLCGMK